MRREAYAEEREQEFEQEVYTEGAQRDESVVEQEG